MTPLPEELGAIIGWPILCDTPCLPDMSDDFRKDFESFFGLKAHHSGRLVRGKEVDLAKFLEHLAGSEASGTFNRKMCLFFCLFARFLFVHVDPAVGHASILSIVIQCEQGRTPMPLCTGELFASLDRSKRDPRVPLGGCPLVLQLWLMERLSFMEPPVGRYNPKGVLSRRRLHGCTSQHEWLLVLSNRRVTVRWTVPWWNIGTLVEAESSPYIRVVSFSLLTFYFPVRVRRQYGRRQLIPDSDTLRPLDKPLSRGGVHSWEEYWMSRPRVAASLLSREDSWVSRHYLAWITTKTVTGKAEARAAERGNKRPDSTDTPAPKSRAISIKDRLGPRKLPVRGRTERLPSIVVGPDRGEGKRERGETLEVFREKEKTD